jgi:hypothetical protein
MDSEDSVFISSTSDLVEERTEAIRAILTMNCNPVSMENWAASSDRPRERIKEKLATCDIFVLLAGFRYGEIVEETRTSFVELEYNEAVELGLRIVVLMRDSTSSEVDDQQRVFRETLSKNHTRQTWQRPGDVPRLVMGSLCEIIIGRQAAPAFSRNVDLVPRIESYLDHATRRGFKLRAYVIQYSAANALEIVRAFLWRGVPTELYVISADSKHVISPRQEKRVKDNIDEIITNLRRPGEPSSDHGLLSVFAYDTPGSIRAVMVKRVVDDTTAAPDFLAVGAYVYMKIPERVNEELDIRGGEMPGIILRPKHDGFKMHADMICGMLENWHANAKCGQVQLQESKKAEEESSVSTRKSAGAV